MPKNKLTSSERAMANACYCPECGGEMVQVSSGGLCHNSALGRCTNGLIKPHITSANFKALKKLKKWSEQDIDVRPDNAFVRALHGFSGNDIDTAS